MSQNAFVNLPNQIKSWNKIAKKYLAESLSISDILEDIYNQCSFQIVREEAIGHNGDKKLITIKDIFPPEEFEICEYDRILCKTDPKKDYNVIEITKKFCLRSDNTIAFLVVTKHIFDEAYFLHTVHNGLIYEFGQDILYDVAVNSNITLSLCSEYGRCIIKNNSFTAAELSPMIISINYYVSENQSFICKEKTIARNPKIKKLVDINVFPRTEKDLFESYPCLFDDTPGFNTFKVNDETEVVCVHTKSYTKTASVYLNYSYSKETMCVIKDVRFKEDTIEVSINHKLLDITTSIGEIAYIDQIDKIDHIEALKQDLKLLKV